jgi:molecular chaperone Hsp33
MTGAARSPDGDDAPADTQADHLHRFLLRGAPVRGEIVSLDAAWRAVVERHDFPGAVRDRLGELCAAALLLSASLKFDGTLILQIHGDGPVALLVVECDAAGNLRATAKLREGQACAPDATFAELVNAHGRGRFAVTLDPRAALPERRPYQGVVPLEGASVADVLERYMARSEQVPTRLWLAADGQRATGLLLQLLPADGGTAPAAADDPDGWNRLQRLADTLTAAELLGVAPGTVVRRLFHREPLHAFDARRVRFGCRCSREKVAAMLRLLGRAEVESIVAERGAVDVRCEFCNTPYAFDAVDGAELFLSEPAVPASPARH